LPEAGTLSRLILLADTITVFATLLLKPNRRLLAARYLFQINAPQKIMNSMPDYTARISYWLTIYPTLLRNASVESRMEGLRCQMENAGNN
jgi:hypothetical protein